MFLHEIYLYKFEMTGVVFTVLHLHVSLKFTTVYLGLISSLETFIRL